MKDLMSWSEKVAKEEEAMKVLVQSCTRCFCWMVKDDHLVGFTSCKLQPSMKVWEQMRAVLPEEVTGDWGHFVEIFGR